MSRDFNQKMNISKTRDIAKHSKTVEQTHPSNWRKKKLEQGVSKGNKTLLKN